MTVHEAVILAGGFGTRLAHVLGNVPKPMAPVAGRPFLTYLLDQLRDAGIERVVLATGHRHEVVEDYFGGHYRGMEIVYSRETEPLYTGGAVLQAAQFIRGDNFLVLNGDTLFSIDFKAFSTYHDVSSRPITVALRQVADTARYGAVELSDGCIRSFREKDDSHGVGLINGGIYAVNRLWLQRQQLPRQFSFEREVLQVYTSKEQPFAGMAFEDYFIDIGVPDDYRRAQQEFLPRFCHDEALFLDRDGVLNRRIVGDYVRSWAQWKWLPGAKDAVARLARNYRGVFVVTNQQGVGKGLFTREALDAVHECVMQELTDAGGRIDRVYVCTALESEQSLMRKPGIGMALQTKVDYPWVDFGRAVMVGDSLSDMLFGWRAGMRCVFVTNSEPIPDAVCDYTDICVSNLAEWADFCVASHR